MEEKVSQWTRIPAPIEAEADRRSLVAILAASGMDVRIVRVRLTARGSVKRFVEYRPQPEDEA